MLRNPNGDIGVLFNQHDLPSDELAAEIVRLRALIADLQQLQRGVGADKLAGHDAPILDRWALSERTLPCLIGLSTGHPKLPGTRLVRTSDLWLLAENGSCARTLSRWYRLGRPFQNSAFNA